jgi:hypothetical protein
MLRRAKQAAEKGLETDVDSQAHPSGAKAQIIPIGFIGTTEVMP